MRPLACVVLVTALTGAASAAPVRVLLLSGQNNHDWKSTTPRIEQILKEAGPFVVTVVEKPETLDPASLAGFDVILSNWNTFGAKEGAEWPPVLRTAYAGFVRGGRGHVALHAGSSSFYDWPDYQDIGLATWKNGQTSHGARHTFAVRPVASHPVTRGLPPFETLDELWNKPGVQPGATVIAEAFSDAAGSGTGAWEPSVLAGSFGKGRCLTILLGHDTTAMAHPYFAALLARGVEWAARGTVTLPPPKQSAAAATLAQTLARMQDYRFGANREALIDLERQIHAAAADAKARADAAEVLRLNLATRPQAEVLQQFALVGDDRDATFVAGFLANTNLQLAALGVLEKWGGPQSRRVVRTLANATDPVLRAACLRMAGRLQDAEAIPVLQVALTDPRPSVAAAALSGLAALGGEAAARALLDARATAKVPAADWATAFVGAAAAAPSLKGELETAVLALYRDQAQPMAARIAALRLLTRETARGGADVLRAALAANVPAIQSAALQIAAETGQTTLVIAALPKLSPGLLEQALSGLGEGAAAVAAATPLLGSPHAGVRAAAARAVAAAGGKPAAEALLEWAPADEDAAVRRDALVRVRGKDADAVLVTRLTAGTEAESILLAGILADRGTAAARPPLHAMLESRDPARAAAAAKALERIGNAESAAKLVGALEAGAMDADATAIMRTLGAIGLRDAKATAAMAAALRKASETVQRQLLEVFPQIGNAEALKAVVGGLESPSAAVRSAAVESLAAWKTPEPLERLVGLAESGDTALRPIAARGAARQLRLATNRPPAEFAALLERVLTAAPGTAERRAVLGAAGAVAAPETVRVVLPRLEDPELSGEARAALEAMLPRLNPVDRKPVEDVLRARGAKEGADRPTSQTGPTGQTSSTGLPPLAWEKGERRLALRAGTNTVWAFDARETPKPYFHPLALPGGPAMTWQSPPDHVWHRGLWFSWKYINGINYWEEDNKTGLSQGRTEVTACTLEAKDDHSARMELALRYRPHDADAAVLTEKRSILVSAPAADGSYRIDWQGAFTAAATPLTFDASAPNRYAGLGCRFYRDWTGMVVNATAPLGEWAGNRLKYAATAADFSLPTPAGPVGVAMLDHPANLNHPTSWYVVNDTKTPFTFAMPAVLRPAPFKLEPGASFTLRYRVIVHPGTWDAARLEKEQAEFARTQKEGTP